jgi:hypothetical protein
MATELLVGVLIAGVIGSALYAYAFAFAKSKALLWGLAGALIWGAALEVAILFH